MKIKLIKYIHLFDYREVKSFKDFFSIGPKYLEKKTFEKSVDIKWLKEAPENIYIEGECPFSRFVDLTLSFPVYKGRMVLGRDDFKKECERSLKNDWRETV